jgi:hypothetical protein
MGPLGQAANPILSPDQQSVNHEAARAKAAADLAGLSDLQEVQASVGRSAG